MSDGDEVVILLDNGSLRAAAALQLRVLATALGEKLGVQVYPVSVLHSSKIDAVELGGEKARTLIPFLRSQLEKGISRFRVVPLFFGPSGALVDYLPKRLQDLREEGWSALEVSMCETLVQRGDDRIARILAAFVLEQKQFKGWEQAAVALCDHGTPSREVHAVRELVAEQLAGLLGEERMLVRACSMERREGVEYDFNEPLLEGLLGSSGFEHQVIVAMLFLLPGRHAGDEGDVAQICAAAGECHDAMDVVMTDLVGHQVEALTEVLVDRYTESL